MMTRIANATNRTEEHDEIELRSASVKREFQLTHTCPATGRTSKTCPGYVKDHVLPLACGGPDAVSNLQWQTIRDARAKDRSEMKGCTR
jgi:hypothetical protein